MTSLTLNSGVFVLHKQSGDLGAVEDGAAAHGEADARADEPATEHRREKQILRDVGVGNDGEADRQAAHGDGTLECECTADETVAQGDERHVDDRDRDRERPSEDAGEQHGYARDAAVDAGKWLESKKALQAESCR